MMGDGGGREIGDREELIGNETLKVPTLKYILVKSFQNLTFSLIMIQFAAYMWSYCIIQDSHIIYFNDCIAE